MDKWILLYVSLHNYFICPGCDWVRWVYRWELNTLAWPITTLQPLALNDVNSTRWQHPYLWYFGFIVVIEEAIHLYIKPNYMWLCAFSLYTRMSYLPACTLYIEHTDVKLPLLLFLSTFGKKANMFCYLKSDLTNLGKATLDNHVDVSFSSH